MKYFWLTIKHKWFVFLASFKVGLPLWRALVHDLSKFSRAELPHYNRQFCGDKGDPEGFARAWHHHIVNNPHHPEHWTYIDKDGEQVLQMPAVDIVEMVADWLGASRAYTGSWDMAKWLSLNLHKRVLHENTWTLLLYCLKDLGYLATVAHERTMITRRRDDSESGTN